MLAAMARAMVGATLGVLFLMVMAGSFAIDLVESKVQS